MPYSAFVDSWERADPETADDLLRMRFRFDRARFLQYCFPTLFYRAFNPYHRDVLSRPKVDWRTRAAQGVTILRADAAPRGIAKTTMGKGDLVHDIVYDLEGYIGVLSAETRLARAITKHLRRIFLAERSPLAKLYGPFRVEGGVDEFSVQVRDRERVGVLARSFGTQIRGANEDGVRFTKLLIDDGERSDRVRNPVLRAEDTDFLNEDVLKAGPIEGGLSVDWRGTVLHPDSILANLLKNGGWEAKKYQALPKWPTRLDLWEQCGAIWKDLSLGDLKIRRACALAFYQANRADMDAGAELLDPAALPLFKFFELVWSQGMRSVLKELQNEPRDSATSLFDSTTFRRCRIAGDVLVTSRGKRIPIPSLRRALYLDPIPGENLGTLADDGGAGSGDLAAIAVAGVDEHKNAYLLEGWMRRCRDTDILAAMWQLGKRWGVRRARIEANGFGRFVTRDFRRAQQQRRAEGKWAELVIDQDDNRKGNEELIAALEVPLTNGWYELVDTLPPRMLAQFDDFPNADHDDFPTAAAGVYRLLGAGPPTMGQTRIQ